MEMHDPLLQRAEDRDTIASSARDALIRISIGACLVLCVFVAIHGNAIAHGHPLSRGFVVLDSIAALIWERSRSRCGAARCRSIAPSCSASRSR